MTAMLQSMKHRGPDSTGYALYRAPSQELVLRVKLNDQAEAGDVYAADDLRRRRRDTEAHLRAAGAQILSIEEINDYTIARQPRVRTAI